MKYSWELTKRWKNHMCTVTFFPFVVLLNIFSFVCCYFFDSFSLLDISNITFYSFHFFLVLVIWLLNLSFFFFFNTSHYMYLPYFYIFYCSNHCTIITEVHGPQQKKIKQTRKGNQCSCTKNVIPQWQHCDVQCSY